MSQYSQFALFGQRRFMPYFSVQALGALNDNVYRQAIIGLLFVMGVSAEERTLYTNLAPALFILPFFLFSAIAGQIAERMEKSKLIRITTLLEIGIMSVAAIGFVTQNMAVLLVALFFTGVQAALFGPVKYSILPSVLRPEELTGGNGLVEMGTSISILCGMIVGGLIFAIAGEGGAVIAATTIVALAVAGNLLARRIPVVDAGAPDLKIQWNPVPQTIATWRLTRRQPAVRNAVLGVSWFWFIGTMLTAQLPTYAEVNLGGAQELYIFALALFSVGVGVGSVLCEKLSGRTVEIGLVPLGAFGVSVFMLDLYFARPGEALLAGLGVLDFIQAPGNWRIVIDLTGVGVFVGFYVVPLFALIQSRTPRAELSRVFAGLNIQNSAFIVAAALIGIAVQRFLGWTIPQVFLALAIANLLVATWIFSVVPEFLMRFLSWLLVRVLYRLRLHGIEQNVPDEGAALVVCNHVSYMDALILAASLPRPARFVMHHRIFEIPVMNWIFRTARAIPIAGATEDRDLMERAFEQIDQALAGGEIVVIFPEGHLTRDGEIAPFRSGVERILARRPVTVVPMTLKNMWRSIWSRKGSRYGQLRIPQRFRAPIDVVAGTPVPGASATAEALEQQVRLLRGDAA